MGQTQTVRQIETIQWNKHRQRQSNRINTDRHTGTNTDRQTETVKRDKRRQTDRDN